MLAYLFWHHPAPGANPLDYEESLQIFHAALAADPPPGFLGSSAFAFSGAPWFPAGQGYLDWYAIADFQSLGLLNEAAVAASRKGPHDQVASLAGGGFGGVSKLVAGSSRFEQANFGTWIAKPPGVGYAPFLEHCSGLLDESARGLWQRQMTLGPGAEFCILSQSPLEAPQTLAPVTVALRRVGVGHGRSPSPQTQR